MIVSLDDMRRELQREERAREKIYKRLVDEGRLSEHQRLYRQRVIQQILALIDAVERNGGWPESQNADE